MSDHASRGPADTTPGGPAPTGAETAAIAKAQASAPETQAVEVERQAAADRWTAEQTANGQRRDRELAEQLYREAAQYEPGRFWRVITTDPDGRIDTVEYVDRDEVVERLAAATFETEQRPGWAVTAEPIET